MLTFQRNTAIVAWFTVSGLAVRVEALTGVEFKIYAAADVCHAATNGGYHV
jgi:hypothetical protein